MVDGNGDAFRHTYFSALNAYDLGKDLATRLGTAHEAVPLTTKLQKLQHDMDMHNNEKGWGLERLASEEDIRNRVISILNNGDLWIISPFNGGTLTPSHP